MTVSAPQLGKSLMLGCWLLAGAWTDGGARASWPSWWAAPTYDQAKSGFLRYVVSLARSAGVLRSHTESVPVRATLMNGSVLEARSWDRPDGLYGPTVARIAVDEFGLLTDEAWAALSSRTTETAMHGYGQIRMAGNVAEIGGTAERLFRIAQGGSPGWAARTWTWRHRSRAARCECGLNGEGTEIEHADLHGQDCERGTFLRQLAAIRRIMSEAQFRQLYGAEWIDWASLPVYAFDRTKHVRDDLRLDEHLPLDLACDFNVDPMVWVIGQHTASEAWALDEIVLAGGATTAEACRVFLDRYRGHKPGVRLYGDASGQARKTSASRSDYQIIRETLGGAFHYFESDVPHANPPVQDRVNAVNAALRSANGETRYWLHPKAERLATDLARVSWKPGTRDIDKSNRALTHASDADGYRISRLFPIRRAIHVPRQAAASDYSDPVMGATW